LYDSHECRKKELWGTKEKKKKAIKEKRLISLQQKKKASAPYSRANKTAKHLIRRLNKTGERWSHVGGKSCKRETGAGKRKSESARGELRAWAYD